uniref:UDP-N-acetylmuramate dehydrogenase n=1 Tax=viral metagenome TaxID=1070528 RepID=A0A6M3M4U8_9ZZZZ
MKVLHGKSFKGLTTFKIGGVIENLYYPTTTEEVATLLCSDNTFHIIGAGSKILASEGSFENVLCTRLLNKTHFEGTQLRVEAGAYAPSVSVECMKRGLSGVEFLIDIPATIGGAVIMNAGFMGHEMSGVCASVEYVTLEGEIKETTDIQWSRRWCSLQGAGVVTAVTLNLTKKDSAKIKKQMKEYHKIRVSRQPQNVASAGGIFINHAVLPWVLEEVPYLRCGDAEIVEGCPNFIVNHDRATFEEVMHLINLIEEHAQGIGISMKLEVKIIEEKRSEV